MNRTAHAPCRTANHTARLCVSIHDQNLTTPIRACSEHGLVISHALTTEALPSMTGHDMKKNIEELLATLDELLDHIDRYHEALQDILKEFQPQAEDQDA